MPSDNMAEKAGETVSVRPSSVRTQKAAAMFGVSA
jgi:hypothetical protein